MWVRLAELEAEIHRAEVSEVLQLDFSYVRMGGVMWKGRLFEVKM